MYIRPISVCNRLCVNVDSEKIAQPLLLDEYLDIMRQYIHLPDLYMWSQLKNLQDDSWYLDLRMVILKSTWKLNIRNRYITQAHYFDRDANIRLEANYFPVSKKGFSISSNIRVCASMWTVWSSYRDLVKSPDTSFGLTRFMAYCTSISITKHLTGGTTFNITMPYCPKYKRKNHIPWCHLFLEWTPIFKTFWVWSPTFLNIAYLKVLISTLQIIKT